MSTQVSGVIYILENTVLLLGKITSETATERTVLFAIHRVLAAKMTKQENNEQQN